MSDLKEIKQRIFEESKIEYLLELLGCHSVNPEQNGKLITSGLPDEDNTRTVQVKNNCNLISNIRNKGISGDIFDIVKYMDDCTLSQAKYKICNLLDYEMTNYKPKTNWNEKLHRIQRKRNKDFELEINEILDHRILNRYIQLPNQYFLEQGISIETQKKFNLMFDAIDTPKVLIPIYDKNGNLISVKCRVLPEYCENGMKYFYMYPYNRNINLYNLNNAREHIDKYVMVFESEKACMFATQWGYPACVSTQGDQITPAQINELRKLNCKIIFIFDKDVKIEFLNKYKSQLCNRVCYAIIDNSGLLQGKDSPTDRGKEVFEKLIKDKNNQIRL